MRKKLLLAFLCLVGIVSTQARTVSLDTLNVYSYVLQNNDVLIGTSTNKRAAAQIADNATITLQNVKINHMDTISGENAIPGIECLGNATIRLVGDNYVHSMYYDMPGIFVPQGSTLTIEGPGSLEVRATIKNDQYRAPAIGNCFRYSSTKHSGNIVIKGGTILALSGSSPAIGSGSDSDVSDISYNQYSCGDITISGGSVMALTGNPNCCAIGARNNSTCGNITITDGVTKVTATRGQNALSTIGKSLSNCACGTITIGGVVYPNGVTANPYTYEPSAPAPCNAPSNLSVSNVAQSSATISWTPGNAGDTQWVVIYGPRFGSGDNISLTVTTNPYTLTGLNPGTNYNVWVKTDCGEEYSQFAAYQSFRTEEPAPCNAPSNLSVSNVAQSSATISWTPGNAGDTQWVVIYGPRFGSGDNISQTVTTNPYTLTELTPNTEYSVWVKTDCGEEYSGYSNYLSFRTEDRTDKTVITACALQGYDGSAFEVGTTFTYQLGRTIARAITPINAAAPYTTSLSGGYLYKKDDEGRFMEVADNTVLEAGEYIFAIMLHIIQPEATDYRFPRNNEGITVDVTVDGVTWSANPRNYQDGGASGSSIMAGTPAFTLGSEDDPAEIEAARSELEDYIDYLEAALQAVEDQTLGVQLFQAKTNAQAVYDNPNATLQEINEAIESCDQALTAAGPTFIEKAIEMYIIQFRAQLATYGELSEACQAAADDYITKLEALAYIPMLSYVENLQYMEMKMVQYTKLLEEQFKVYGCEPSEEALDDVQPDKLQGTKLLRDGQLFILRNGKTYDARGAEVR